MKPNFKVIGYLILTTGILSGCGYIDIETRREREKRLGESPQYSPVVVRANKKSEALPVKTGETGGFLSLTGVEARCGAILEFFEAFQATYIEGVDATLGECTSSMQGDLVVYQIDVTFRRLDASIPLRFAISILPRRDGQEKEKAVVEVKRQGSTEIWQPQAEVNILHVNLPSLVPSLDQWLIRE